MIQTTPEKAAVEAMKSPGPVRDRTVIVAVPAEGKLAQLLCMWQQKKDELDAAEAAYDLVKSGITHELTSMYPDGDIKVYEVPANAPMWSAVTYSYSRSEYLPAAKVREHLKPIYEAFKEYKESWVLRKKGKR